MEINIIEEKQNPLFNRKEIIFELEAEITPSHVDVEKIISEKFSTQPESFKVKKIEGKFGSKVFKISANIYPSREEKEDTEFKTKQEKEAEIKALEEGKKAEQEKKKAEKEAEEKPNEAPVETEEKPAEESKQEEKAE